MGSKAQRGEVWWANVDERRPLVVLSGETDSVRAILVVPPATIAIEGIAMEIPIGAAEGLTEAGVVRVAFPHKTSGLNCHWLVNVAPEDLIERAGALSREKLLEVEEALRIGDLE